MKIAWLAYPPQWVRIIWYRRHFYVQIGKLVVRTSALR